MSANLHELCCSLVEELYGEFHRCLFSHLIYHGRLSAAQIAQKSRLSVNHIKTGLALLVQSRLVYHHTTSDGLSTYQANSTSSYNLLRTGRLIELVRTHLGSLAAIVISESILLGFATISEIETKALEALAKQQAHSANSLHDSKHASSEDSENLQAAISTLIDHNYLMHVRSAHFQTDFDARQDVEKRFKIGQTSQSQRGKKASLEIDAQVDVELRLRVSSKSEEYGYVPDVPSSRKRTLDEADVQSSSKRQKLNGNIAAEVNSLDASRFTLSDVDCATVVYASFQNVILDVRNTYMVRRAKKTLGTTCGNILAQALLQVPSTNFWSKTPDDNVIDVRQIRDGINSPTNSIISNGFHQNGDVKVNGTHTNEKNEHYRQAISYNEVDRSLALLEDSEFSFLQGSHSQEWHISKFDMDIFIRNQEILRMMGDQLRPPALRIVRMLIDKGKLDEKTLQEVGLLSAKELRQTLAQLKQMGFVDLQEVPRESQRQPNRTIFLWFYDPTRVQKVLLDCLYKTMARLMQRMIFERKELSSTLEKIERSDVQGNEEHIMSTAELRVLRRWQKTEQWLLGEVARLDESVVLLRDL